MEKTVALTINIPESLKKRLEASAKKSKILVDQEISSRLELSYEDADPLRRRVLNLESDIEDMKERYRDLNNRYEEKMEMLDEVYAALGIGNA